MCLNEKESQKIRGERRGKRKKEREKEEEGLGKTYFEGSNIFPTTKQHDVMATVGTAN